MKIKICYLISSLCNEGPVNVVYNIIKYINFNKFDVSIITFIPEKENTRFEEFKRFPIKIYQLSSDKQYNLLKLYGLLKKQVKIISPNILHAHCPRSLYLMYFLSGKYKKFYTIHIYPGKQQLNLYGPIKGRIIIALNHFFTQKVDLAIGCAESVAEQYKKEKGWNIKAIPNGSSLPVWERNKEERSKLRKEFGLKDNIKYFIFIGRFSKEKNPDILYNVFNKLKNKNIGLIMLGQGPMWKMIHNENSSNIIMPGFTTRVYDYLKASDYYISASDVEGLANTLLESMSVGLPCALSNIPSHREVLSKAEKNIGFIFDQKDINSIENTIYKLMTLDYISTSSYIQSLFENNYTAKIMSEKYQSEYEKVLKKI